MLIVFFDDIISFVYQLTKQYYTNPGVQESDMAFPQTTLIKCIVGSISFHCDSNVIIPLKKTTRLMPFELIFANMSRSR